jgi:hypothetical protein
MAIFACESDAGRGQPPALEETIHLHLEIDGLLRPLMAGPKMMPMMNQRFLLAREFEALENGKNMLFLFGILFLFQNFLKIFHQVHAC